MAFFVETGALAEASRSSHARASISFGNGSVRFRMYTKFARIETGRPILSDTAAWSWLSRKAGNAELPRRYDIGIVFIAGVCVKKRVPLYTLPAPLSRVRSGFFIQKTAGPRFFLIDGST